MLPRSLSHIIIRSIFDPNVKYNFIQHCFCDLGSHFEALESVLIIFFLVYASKKYDQTDSRAPKCLPRVTKTVMYKVIMWPRALLRFLNLGTKAERM
jgi:hypothetical protein